MTTIITPYLKGRGAQIQLNNSFESLHSTPLLEYFDEEAPKPKSKYLKVHPKTIVNKVASPDVPMYFHQFPTE